MQKTNTIINRKLFLYAIKSVNPMQIKTFNHIFTFENGKCYRDGHYFGEIVEENDRYFVVKTSNELKTFLK